MVRALLIAAGTAVIAWAQPAVVPRPFRLEELITPAGFEVRVFARVNGGPRLMAFGPNGILYVAAREAGTVVAVPAPDQTVTVLRGLRGPHALAFRDQDLFVAVDDGVLRFRGAVTSNLAVSSQAERILSSPTGGQHTTRTLGFGPDGAIFVTAGSSCNFCVETDPRRAAIQRFEADGSGGAVYARGMRNPVGFAWHPLTGELWATDNGGDGLGDDEPPEEINIVRQGGDYGWPDCVGQGRGVRWGAEARPERCHQTIGPELEMQAHSAPLGISFYAGDQFPASFVNDALVAFHGSWNRNEPTGYKVVRVRSASGHATAIEDFLWGFLDAETRTHSGRPVHALAGPDGAVYVSDDSTGNIYRVVYTGPRINPGGIVARGERIFELYGSRLAADPAQLNVFANGQPVEIPYASATQINFVLPEGISGDVTITVHNERAEDSAAIHVD